MNTLLVLGDGGLFFSAILWTAAALSCAGLLFWVYETGWLARRTNEPSSATPITDIQVRVLTVEAENLVQECVNSIPDPIDDIHVIAETPLTIPGATVNVVPEDFDCDATRKGRALEWSRQNVSCSKEYILYLDEDTIVTDLQSIPDADIVQFGERPSRTGSLVTYLAEILRLGYQTEQRAFGSLRYPLYAWGGGIAVRSALESRVDWNVDTLIEDTVFAWRAARFEDVEFCTAKTTFSNQAPPTIGSMISQRRRWIAGAHEHSSILPLRYRLLIGLRNMTWSIVVLLPLALLIPPLLSTTLVFESALHLVTGTLYLCIAGIALVGVRYYDESLTTGVLLIILLPVVGFAHAVGALVGLVAPPNDFEVTEKVTHTTDSVEIPESKSTRVREPTETGD